MKQSSTVKAVFYVLLTIIILTTKTTLAYISRNPHCRYSAKYSFIYNGTYFNSTDRTVSIANVTRRECSLYCTLNTTCLFYNQRKDSARCELVTTHVGKFQQNPEWEIISTNYTDWKYRGPNCRLLRPFCRLDHYCIDKCGPPGYACKHLHNIARHKHTKAKSVHSSETSASHIVDGKQISTSHFMSKKEKHTWVMIDLAHAHKIIYMVYFNQGLHLRNSSKLINIKIGDHDENSYHSNTMCVHGEDFSHTHRIDVFCDKGRFLSGRYVFLIRYQGNQVFTLTEFVVYAF